MKSKYFLFTGLLILLLAGCSTGPASTAESVAENGGASVTGATLGESKPGSYVFSVNVESPGDPVGIDFRGTATMGNLNVQLLDAAGDIAWERTVEVGPFAINEVVHPDAAGVYRLGLVWDGEAKAQYSLMWQPGEIQQPVVTALALIQGAGMVLVALAFILYAAFRRLGVGYLALGALAWVVTVVVKFAIAIPLNPVVLDRLAESGLPQVISGPLSWIYIGVLTGITEILITYLFLRYTRLGKAVWERVLSFGIGFGAVEALLLGIGPLISVIAAILVPATLPVEALNSLTLLNNPLYGFAGVWERFFTILIHIFSNVLIFYTVLRREPKWFWLAFVYKSGLDAVAGYAQLSGNLASLGFIWAIEAFVAVMGILGWIGIRWIGKKYREAWEITNIVEEPMGGILGTAVEE